MLAHLALSENGLLFDNRSGKSFSVNPVAVSILNKLMAGESTTTLGQSLSEEFEVDAQKAEQDVDAFWLRLQDLGLL